MDLSEKFVPISNLPSAAEAYSDAPITWDFSLPPTLDTERLVVNTRQLQRIMGVAALRAIHVTEYQGNTTTASPNISGVNAHGVATASMTSTLQKSETQKSHLVDDYSVGIEGADIMRSHGKTRAFSKLNKSEIVSRVVDKTGQGQKREDAWAHEIDSALNASIRMIAKEHLTKRETEWLWKYMTRFYYAHLGIENTMNSMEGDASTPLGYVLVSGMLISMDTLRIRKLYGQSLLKERRWSFTPLAGEQWDRYAATQALTRTIPLIKSRA